MTLELRLPIPTLFPLVHAVIIQISWIYCNRFDHTSDSR